MNKDREKICDEIKKIEEEINKNISNDVFLTNKLKEIEVIREKLKEKTTLSEADFDSLKCLAVSKGGFILNENRRDLWKKILNVEQIDDKFDFIFIKDNLNKYQKNNDIFQSKKEEITKGI